MACCGRSMLLIAAALSGSAPVASAFIAFGMPHACVSVQGIYAVIPCDRHSSRVLTGLRGKHRPTLSLGVTGDGRGGKDLDLEKEFDAMKRDNFLGYKDERAGVGGEMDSPSDGVPPVSESLLELMKNIFSGERRGPVGPSPLLSAVISQDEVRVRKFIERGENVNAASRIDEPSPYALDEPKRGYTPLREAVAMGNLNIVKLLLQAGAKPNYSSMLEEDQGATPLFIASANGRIDIVKELLQAGADPDSCRQDGATSLHMAASCKQVEVVRTLIKAGANCNLMTSEGATPLREAVISGSAEIVQALVEGGAQIDQGCKLDSGAPPVLIAAAEGQLDIVRELVQAGADVNKADFDGMTAMKIAVSGGNQAMIYELSKAEM